MSSIPNHHPFPLAPPLWSWPSSAPLGVPPMLPVDNKEYHIFFIFWKFTNLCTSDGEKRERDYIPFQQNGIICFKVILNVILYFLSSIYLLSIYLLYRVNTNDKSTQNIFMNQYFFSELPQLRFNYLQVNVFKMNTFMI